jgi:hypothetical protein
MYFRAEALLSAWPQMVLTFWSIVFLLLRCTTNSMDCISDRLNSKEPSNLSFLTLYVCMLLTSLKCAVVNFKGVNLPFSVSQESFTMATKAFIAEGYLTMMSLAEE